MGRTGAGKSTFLRCTNGIIPNLTKGDFSGSVSVLGEEISGKKPYDLAGTVGLVFQDFEKAMMAELEKRPELRKTTLTKEQQQKRDSLAREILAELAAGNEDAE